MRRIGTLPTEQDARTFADYLFSLDIKTQADCTNGEWVVWALDEDRLAAARDALEEFRAQPRAAKYAAAAATAQKKRAEALQETLAARKKQVNLRERWERPAMLRLPVTSGLIGLSLAVTLITGFGRQAEPVGRYLYILERPVGAAVGERATDLWVQTIQSGEVWRLITPIFLHFSLLHVIGNISIMMLLATMLEQRQGSWRLLVRVLIIALISNLAQYFSTGPLFGGMSGVGYGLFGYCWMKGRFDPESGIGLSQGTVVFLLVWLVACSIQVGSFQLIGHVANTAHSVGLIVGLLMASDIAIKRWLR